jgi:alpha-N-acetylglucosaminidase
VQALRLFVQAGQRNEVNAGNSSTYSCDLVDLGRQMLCNAFTDAANVAGAEYARALSAQVNNSVAVVATMAVRGDVLAQLDTLLATDTIFLLSHWLADANLWANGNGTVAAFLEENARNQITLWGFVGGDIADYAAKNGWSGLVRDYYGARWALQAEYVMNATLAGTPVTVNWAAYSTELGELEAAWVAARNPYPTSPSGDALEEASAALMRFATGNASRYHALQDTDAFPPGAGVSVDIYRAWHKDSRILMTLCDADPACVGLNSNGYLKNNTKSQQASDGGTLWLKRSRSCFPPATS